MSLLVLVQYLSQNSGNIVWWNKYWSEEQYNEGEGSSVVELSVPRFILSLGPYLLGRLVNINLNALPLRFLICKTEVMLTTSWGFPTVREVVHLKELRKVQRPGSQLTNTGCCWAWSVLWSEKGERRLSDRKPHQEAPGSFAVGTSVSLDCSSPWKYCRALEAFVISMLEDSSEISLLSNKWIQSVNFLIIHISVET